MQIQAPTQSLSESFTKTKKNLYKALNEKQVSDSKTFWKNIKPFFSDNGVNSSKITLVGKKQSKKQS